MHKHPSLKEDEWFVVYNPVTKEYGTGGHGSSTSGPKLFSKPGPAKQSCTTSNKHAHIDNATLNEVFKVRLEIIDDT